MIFLLKSLVVCITLQSLVSDLEVTFNLGDVAALIRNDRGPVQVNLVVDDQEWVVCVHDVVVD